jgi:hypothetical protein
MTPAGLPDYVSKNFPFTDAMDLLQTHHALLLRQLLPLTLLQSWLPAFEKGFQAADLEMQTGQMPLDIYQNLYIYGHVHPSKISAYHTWHLAVLDQALFRRLLQVLLGDSFALMVKNAYPRRQGGRYREHAIDWHQDASFLGPLPAINTWIPLTPAGGDYPGLELVLGNGQHWTPRLEPGDVLVFNPLTQHRTFLPQNTENLRISSELRWLKPEGFAFTSSPLLPVNLSEEMPSV